MMYLQYQNYANCGLKYIVNPYKMMEKAGKLVNTYTHMNTYRNMGAYYRLYVIYICLEARAGL